MFDSINVGPVVCTEIQYYLFSSLPSVHVILDVGPIEHAFRILQKVRSGLICVLVSFHSVHPPLSCEWGEGVGKVESPTKLRVGWLQFFHEKQTKIRTI